MLSNILRGNFDLPSAIIYIISSLIVVFLTLPIHEFSHGFAASKLGDPTPKYQGRLTLNPFAHIDWLGAACILIFGFGWAKPVQVNARYFNNPKRDMAVTALAGPVSNLAVALICLLINNIIGYFVGSVSFAVYFIYNVIFYIASINVSLAVFNLIPIPPLDGSRLLAAFLPDRIYYKIMRYERYLIWIVFILIYVGALDKPLSFASSNVLAGLNNLASLPFKFLN